MMESTLSFHLQDIQKSASFRFARLLGLYQLKIRLIKTRFADEVVEEEPPIHLKVLNDKQTVLCQNISESFLHVHLSKLSFFRLEKTLNMLRAD